MKTTTVCSAVGEAPTLLPESSQALSWGRSAGGMEESVWLLCLPVSLCAPTELERG